MRELCKTEGEGKAERERFYFSISDCGGYVPVSLYNSDTERNEGDNSLRNLKVS